MAVSRHQSHLAVVLQRRMKRMLETAQATNTTVFIPGGAVVTPDRGSLEIVVSSMTVGVLLDIPINFTGIWTGWTLVADAAGDIQFDLWKDVISAFPPTIADTICGGAKPHLTAAAAANEDSIPAWDTAFAPGDVLRVNLDSVATIKFATLSLKWKRLV